LIFSTGHEILFAHTSFKWTNLASHNAGVTVAIIGVSKEAGKVRRIYSIGADGSTLIKNVEYINAYLAPAANVMIEKAARTIADLTEMLRGNMPYDGGHLLLAKDEVISLDLTPEQRGRFIRRIYGSAEFIHGIERYCLWIEDKNLGEAMSIKAIVQKIDSVRQMRLSSKDAGANQLAERSHQMREMNIGFTQTIVMPCVSSESRQYLPVGLVDKESTVTNLAFALYDAALWNMSLIASRLHLVWIGTVCGKLKADFRYSNTLGWNTFPVPTLTDKNKADLTRCAEDILLAREVHYPATIADLYNPETMPANLREAHERNDETLERIYIGRRFRNDTERLEKLFDLYTKMTAAKPATKNKKA
jgi:hypothetical protein